MTKGDCARKWQERAETYRKLEVLYMDRDPIDADEIPEGAGPDEAKREKFKAMKELAAEAADDFRKL